MLKNMSIDRSVQGDIDFTQSKKHLEYVLLCMGNYMIVQVLGAELLDHILRNALPVSVMLLPYYSTCAALSRQ